MFGRLVNTRYIIPKSFFLCFQFKKLWFSTTPEPPLTVILYKTFEVLDTHKNKSITCNSIDFKL